MEKELYCLSVIKLPDETCTDAAMLRMYVKTESSQEGENSRGGVLRFDTWMNSFSAKKYYQYCDLGNINLKLNFKGMVLVTVYGCSLDAAGIVIKKVLSKSKCSDGVLIDLKDVSGYDSVYFDMHSEDGENIKFEYGEWCTDKKPNELNRLAVICCTYKREEYIYKNLEKLHKFFQNSSIRDRIDIIVVDNGQTLDKKCQDRNVNVIPNKNLGGAGGFARGIYEVLESYPYVTRCVLMDDDIELEPEAIHKMLLLCDYLKDNYRNAFIAGTMLDKKRPNILYENLAIEDVFWVHAYITNLRLDDYANIIKSNNISPQLFGNPNERVSSAWWCHCFPIELVKEKGLPMPFFIRTDDIEWSWRNQGNHHITMNGIGVWHEPFKWRCSAITEHYFTYRNMFFVRCLYDGKLQHKIVSIYEKRFKQLIRTYDYVSVDLLLIAMEDVLKGCEILKQDPVVTLKGLITVNRLRKMQKATSDEIERAVNYKSRLLRLKKILYRITANGRYLPKIFFKYNGYALEGDFKINNYILCKTVNVINPLTKIKEIREYNAEVESRQRLKFYFLLNEIEKRFVELKDETIKCHKELTSIEFWKSYFGMNP